jgi:transposase
MPYMAFDSHQHDTLARVENADGHTVCEARIAHERSALKGFLAACEPGSPVAVETVGNWSWLVDEIEAAGCAPKLVHAYQAKLMMGMINNTDKLDARGLNRLQRAGTLPEVWIPQGELRDQRELPRTRMVLVQHRPRLKNRSPATISKPGLAVPAVSDLFGRSGRRFLQDHLHAVPPHTASTLSQRLAGVDALDQAIRGIEQHTPAVFGTSPAVEWLRTLPGVGFSLAVVIASAMGEVRRFARPQEFASYAGTTPRVHASGGKTRYGSLRPDVTRYLQWAFVEAANTSCRVRRRYPPRHVRHLYERLARPKGHQKAIGAVARHLAEATVWMLTKREPYREPHSTLPLGSSTEASARVGELSPLRLDILNATRLRNTFMPREGEEMPLARPVGSLRGRAPFSLFFSCKALSEMLPMKACGAGMEYLVADNQGGQP